ncbi:MAG: UDP-3-O-acyl-N-acetylglucosamine deacetylase [Phycisphaerales bacterium JB060]
MTTPTAHPVARRTLGGPVTIEGVGLFSAQPARVTFKPGHDGLILTRADIAASVPVHHSAVTTAPVHSGILSGQPRSTNLARGHALVATVEHALSAIVGLGITDCDIEIDGIEMPILDGSAKPFVSAMLEVGTRELGDTIEPIVLEQAVKAEYSNTSIVAEPRSEPGWSITYTLDYGKGAAIEAQTVTWDGSADTYSKSIAPARTYCMEYEAQALQRSGLFENLTPADMLVIGRDGPIDNAYRFDKEPATHKLLDAIGDLALAGRPIQADITATRSGHQMNQRLACALTTRFPRMPVDPRP